MSRNKTAAQALSDLRKRQQDTHKKSKTNNFKTLQKASIPSSPPQEINKDSFLAVLAAVWKKFPTLRFGQLISQASKDRIFSIEDEELQEILLSYDPSGPGHCKIKSPSGKFICSLEHNHTIKEHINYELGFSWKV
jgi:hypothetical protein